METDGILGFSKDRAIFNWVGRADLDGYDAVHLRFSCGAFRRRTRKPIVPDHSGYINQGPRDPARFVKSKEDTHG